jgi:1-acyl-sn-glycerol-3-phosphate acyltransferase
MNRLNKKDSNKKNNNVTNLENKKENIIENKMEHIIENKLENNESKKINNIIELKKSNESDIVVNYSCVCKKIFLSYEKILYVLPCCHMIHETCFNKFILDKQYENLSKNKNNMCLNCPMCSNKISCVLTEEKIKSKLKYRQYHIDLKSIRFDTSAVVNYMVLPFALVKLTSVINKIVLIENYDQIIDCIEFLFQSFGIKINIIDNTKNNPFIIKNNTVVWKNKKDQNAKTVIISNHSNYLDSFILYYLFKCGFVSSEFINTTDIGRLIASKTKLLIFKRGVDTDMVSKIKNYLEEMKKIVIYPEGTMGNNNTLLRFRTGAFHTGANICPVVIKYKNFVYDDDIKQNIFKIITQNEIVVDVYINDIFYPPFDNDKIEEVRDLMAKVGNLDKSRVSNRTIKE